MPGPAPQGKIPAYLLYMLACALVVLVSVLYKEELFAENVEVVEHKKHHVVHMHMHNEYLRDKEELQKRHEEGEHNLTYTEDDFEDDQYWGEQFEDDDTYFEDDDEFNDDDSDLDDAGQGFIFPEGREDDIDMIATDEVDDDAYHHDEDFVDPDYDDLDFFDDALDDALPFDEADEADVQAAEQAEAADQAADAAAESGADGDEGNTPTEETPAEESPAPDGGGERKLAAAVEEGSSEDEAVVEKSPTEEEVATKAAPAAEAKTPAGESGGDENGEPTEAEVGSGEEEKKETHSEDGGMDEEFEKELKKAEEDLGSRLNEADGLSLLEQVPKTAADTAPAKKKGKKGRRMLSDGEALQIGLDGLFA